MKLFKRKKTDDLASRSSKVTATPKVISYYTATKRDINTSDRNMAYSQKTILQKKHISKIKKWWFISTIGLSGLLIVGYLLLLSKDPHVIVEGPLYRTKENYSNIAAKAISNNIIYRFKPFIPANKIVQKLQSEIPEASSITVDTPIFLHRLNIKINTASAVGILNQQNNENYYINERGRLLLSKNDSLAKLDNSNLLIVKNNSGIFGEAGEQFILPEEMHALTMLNDQFVQDKSSVIYTLSNVPHEIIVNETSRGGYSIKFVLDETILSQYGALRAVQKKLSESGLQPTQYIDVRLADKIFYK